MIVEFPTEAAEKLLQAAQDIFATQGDTCIEYTQAGDPERTRRTINISEDNVRIGPGLLLSRNEQGSGFNLQSWDIIRRNVEETFQENASAIQEASNSLLKINR